MFYVSIRQTPANRDARKTIVCVTFSTNDGSTGRMTFKTYNVRNLHERIRTAINALGVRLDYDPAQLNLALDDAIRRQQESHRFQ